MNAPVSQELLAPALVEFKLNDQTVVGFEGESILNAAKRHGIAIPHLCYKEGMRADGNCRACVVEIQGERTLAPSCCRNVTPGLEVLSNSLRAKQSQKMVLELLLSDMPEQGYKWTKDGQHGELSDWVRKMDVAVRPALQALKRLQPASDMSHPAMAVNLDACIQCKRCVTACREEQVNDVIAYAHRGLHSQIVFDLQDDMGNSTCVACGECVQACPTGALMPKSQVGSQVVDQKVDSVCPFCGVGCLLTYNIKDNKIVSVDGRDGPANHNRLCVKGRFGFDYIQHPQRLTTPLIRKPGVPKDPALIQQLNRNGADWAAVFREATWEEALALGAGKLKQLRDAFGPKSLAGFGSAKGSNEEAYLFQKLVRTGFGSNNVDHCTRLCHASSVSALLEGVGSAAVSNQVNDVEHAGLIFVIGANPTANHPVAATWMKNAAKRGAKIVLADPRVTDIGKHAWRTLQFKPDTDVAMLNALIYTVIEEGLVDQSFIQTRANNYEALKQNIQGYSPEAMAPICGVPAETLREVAREFATSKAAMILWGMGVSQHIHGTDNARCLIALVSVTGQIGKPGSGLHPLRGQNNVQGASDAGLIPMMYPNYQRVTNPLAHEWFEKFWNTPLDSQPGYTVVEIMHKALADEADPHKVRGMYIMGENPAMSDPDLNHARHALASLEHLVVQDIFMTETAWLADVVLPATAWPEKMGTVTNTDRMVQMGRQAVQAPGQAKADLWIIQQMAKGMGLNWPYAGEHHGVAEVYEEMRQAMHEVISGISWDRLMRESSVTYPCLSEEDPGEPTVFKDHFATADGRVNLVPADIIPANERPDADFPFVLITGRQLEHWHTGSMTRRATVLDAIEPEATASMCGADLLTLGLREGEVMTLASRRGEVCLKVRRDDGTPLGSVFMPFAYYEAAANLMTNAALDPFGKIPEFKYCAVAVKAGGQLAVSGGFFNQTSN
jgi:formate dehydrogenase major subunit